MANTKIDLLEICAKIQNNPESTLYQKVMDSGNPIDISADVLAKKKPELKPLGSLSLIKVAKSKKGNVYVNTLNLFTDENGEVGVYDVKLSPVPKAKIISHKGGYDGFAVVQIEKLDLICNISIPEDFDTLRVDNPKLIEETEGSPHPSNIAPLPRPENPMYNLELGDYTVKAISDRKTGKFQNQIVTLNDSQGNEFPHTIANGPLEKLISKYGPGCKFRITDVRGKCNKDGDPVNHQSKTEDDFESTDEIPVWKQAQTVVLLDLNGEDYSDLDI